MQGSTARSQTAVSPKVILGSYGKVISDSDNWQPRSVREFESAGDGVWHPDDLVPRLFWNGGKFSIDERLGGGANGTDKIWFSPFIQMPDDVLVKKFTERLAESDQVSP